MCKSEIRNIPRAIRVVSMVASFVVFSGKGFRENTQHRKRDIMKRDRTERIPENNRDPCDACFFDFRKQFRCSITIWRSSMFLTRGCWKHEFSNERLTFNSQRLYYVPRGFLDIIMIFRLCVCRSLSFAVAITNQVKDVVFGDRYGFR